MFLVIISFISATNISTYTKQPSDGDTWIDAADVDSNRDTWVTLMAYRWTSPRRSLLKFDISDFSGSSSDITSATLHLYYTATLVSDPSGNQVDVYKVRRTDWVSSESTWNIYKTGSNWGTAGCSNTSTDYDTSLTADATFPAAVDDWMEWDITDIVKDAIDNTSGVVNLMLKMTTEDSADEGGQFCSNNTAEGDSYKPKITIEYTVGESATLSETITMTEAKTGNLDRVLSESMSMTESTTALKGIISTISETIGLTEVISAVVKGWGYLTKHDTNSDYKTKHTTSSDYKTKSTTNWTYKTKN